MLKLKAPNSRDSLHSEIVEGKGGREGRRRRRSRGRGEGRGGEERGGEGEGGGPR